MKKRINWLLVGLLLASFLVVSVPAAAQGSVYEVVWPLGHMATPIIPAAKRLDTLAGKIICEVTNGSFRYDETFPWIEEELSKRYPDIKFVKSDVFETFDYVEIDRKYEVLPERAKENKCDAFIGGNGG